MDIGNFNIRGAAVAGAMALGLVLASGAGTAKAETFDECQAGIATIGFELDDVTFLGRGNDEDGIRRTLDNASNKLSLAKFADAIQKLEDARTKVVELRDAAKPKIADATPDDGVDDIQEVLNAIDAAIACIDALALQSL